MKELTILNNRINQMLLNDKKDNPKKIIGLIKSELFYMLKNYMDIKFDDIELNIGIDNDGKYILDVSAKVQRIYAANYLF